MIDKLNSGDEDAFIEIYNRCYGSIKFLCSKLCGNKEDIEEIIQDTFMVAYNKKEQLRGETLIPYLRKIAIYTCYAKGRKKIRDYEHVIYTDEEIDAVEKNENFLPQAYLEKHEAGEELLRVINSLPKKQKEMVYLFYYADINTEEIAGIYNCTSGNVRKILHTARENIRNKLERSSGEKLLHSAATVPLSALLMVEEAAFITGNVAIGAGFSAVGAAGVVGAVKTVGLSAGAYAVAACALAVGAIATTVYFGIIAPNQAVEEPPPAAVYYQVPESEPQTSYIPEPEPYEAYEYYPETYEYELYEYEIYEDEQISEEIIETYEEPTATENLPYLPATISEPKPEEPMPPIDYKPYEPEYEIYEPEPKAPDRTEQILAALYEASDQNLVNEIIREYGFRFFSTMRNEEDKQLRFYITDEGSGEIMIATAAMEDGTSWHMRFTHVPDGTVPTDFLALLRFMQI